MGNVPLPPSRARLGEREGRMVGVEAVFARTGIKLAGNRAFHTVLLVNVREADTRFLLADHLWFNRGSLWRKMDLRAGDIVSFESRPIEYRTGYWGSNRLRQLEDPPRRDYRLTPPVNLRVVRRAAAAQGEAA